MNQEIENYRKEICFILNQESEKRRENEYRCDERLKTKTEESHTLDTLGSTRNWNT